MRPAAAAFHALLCCAALAARPAAAEDKIIRIGVSTPLSGPGAYFGAQDRQGMELALDELKHEVNGFKLDIHYEDDSCAPLPATQAAKRLLDQYHPTVVLGAECSDASLAMQPIYEQAQVPVIDAGSSTDKLTNSGYRYVFRIFPTASQQERLLATDAYDHLGARSAVILFEKTNGGIDNADDFARPFEKAGGKVLARIDFGRDVNDFTAIATRLSGMGAIDVLPTFALEGQGLKLTQALAQAGIVKGGDGHSVQLGSIWLPYGFEQKAGRAAIGYIRIVQFDPADPRPPVVAFLRVFQAKYPAVVPTHIVAHAYDQVMLVAEAVRRGAHDAQSMRDTLGGMHNLAMVTGTIDFDASGQTINPSVMHVVQTQPDLSWATPAWAKP